MINLFGFVTTENSLVALVRSVVFASSRQATHAPPPKYWLVKPRHIGRIASICNGSTVDGLPLKAQP
jgi:hypothetical protein